MAIAVINATGYGAVQPALQSLCMKSVPSEKRGSASSTNYIAQDGSTIIGPRLCGEVATNFGYTPLMWNVMAVPIVFGAVITFIFQKKINVIENNFQND